MSVIKIKDENGNWKEIPCLKGNKGDKGEQGIQGPKGDTPILTKAETGSSIILSENPNSDYSPINLTIDGYCEQTTSSANDNILDLTKSNGFPAITGITIDIVGTNNTTVSYSGRSATWRNAIFPIELADGTYTLSALLESQSNGDSTPLNITKCTKGTTTRISAIDLNLSVGVRSSIIFTIDNTYSYYLGAFAVGATARISATSVFKDIMINTGATVKPYVEFSPNSPSPDYPSEISVIENEITVTNTDGTDTNSITYDLGDEFVGKLGDVKDYIENGILHNYIDSYIFSGSNDDDYIFSADGTDIIGVNLIPKKVYSVAYQSNLSSQKMLYCSKFNYLFSAFPTTEHIYVTQSQLVDNGYIGNIRLYINHSRLVGYSASLTNAEKAVLVKNWLSNNPLEVYYIKSNPNEVELSSTGELSLYEGNNNITNSENTNMRITYYTDVKGDKGKDLSLEDSGWIEAELTSSFHKYGDSNENTVKYRKIGKMVEITGAVAPTSELGSEAETIIFTLPTGYRPSLKNSSLQQGSSKNSWLLNVFPGGMFTFSRYGTTSKIAAPTTAWLPFHIMYFVD